MSDPGISKAKNMSPFSSLMTSIMRNFSCDVPVIAIKTGATVRSRQIEHPRGVDQMSLRSLLERTNANIKVICLDIRKREDLEELVKASIKKRDEMDEDEIETTDEVQEGKSDYTKDMQEVTDESSDFQYVVKVLLKRGFQQMWSENQKKCESLDCSILAYFHHLLMKHEEIKKWVLALSHKEINWMDDFPTKVGSVIKTTSLVDTIVELENERKPDDIVDCPKFANIFAKEFFRNVLKSSDHTKYYKERMKEMSIALSESEFLPQSNNDGKPPPNLKEDEVLIGIFGSEIQQAAAHIRKLLMSPRFFSANIWSTSIHDDIHDIVLGRRKQKLTMVVLKLLRDALDDVDVTHAAADWYKRFCKASFRVQLFLSFLITLFSVWGANSSWLEDLKTSQINKEGVQTYLKHSTLICSLLLGAVVSIDALCMPRQNWQHLRNTAVSLESMIWKFRMRVGDFEVDYSNENHDRPEERLCKALLDWRTQLLSGTNSSFLSSLHSRLTEIEKDSQFKSRKIQSGEHFQYIIQKWQKLRWQKLKRPHVYSSLTKKPVDDYYSTLTGDEYLVLRARNLKRRYQGKICRNVLSQYTPQIFIVFLGILIAFISELGQASVVSILIAFLSGFNSWIEFRGLDSKSRLYVNAIASCKIQEAKWRGLDKFQAESKENLTNIVMGVEDIALQVMAGWSSTMAEKKDRASTTIESAQRKEHTSANAFNSV